VAPGRSITTRLIILLTLCAALIMGLGILLDYRLSREQILERVRVETRERVGTVIADMEHWLDGVEGDTRLLARILAQREYSRPGLTQMLRDVVENNTDIFGATIALNPEYAGDSRGFAPYFYHGEGGLAYADLAASDRDYTAEEWYTDPVASGSPVWAEPYFDEGGGRILMTTYAVPVYRADETGRQFLYAVVTADIALAELDRYLRRLDLGEEGFGFLLSRSGTVLGAPDPALVMRHYSEAVSDGPDADLWQALVDAALAGGTAAGQVRCPGATGPCAIRMAVLASTGWPVGVIWSEREMLAPLRRFEWRLVATGLLTLLLMALATSLVTRRTTRPLVVLAAASDAVARGDLDTPLPTLSSDDEVGRLVRAFDSMTRDLKEHIAELEAVSASRARLDTELAAAREIQMAMLPGGGEAAEAGEGYTLWARVRPARTVGGDLYSFFRREGRLYLALGDVSDKGIPAALFMARAISLMQEAAANASSPAAALARLNDALVEGNDNCMFVTLFLGELDTASLSLSFASAGHTPPALLRNGAASAAAQEAGPALGLVAGLEFPLNSLQLAPGDRLAVWTDGIDEAFGPGDRMFGSDAFLRKLAGTGALATEAAGNALLAAVDAFAVDVPQADDMALLLLDVAGAGPRESSPTHSFEAGPALAGRVLEWLAPLLRERGVPATVATELLTVTEEIVTNIDRYGGLPGGAAVELATAFTADRVELEVRDPGIPFNPLAEARRADLGAGTDAAEVGGLGVHLITELTDGQTYRRENGCNILRVSKRLQHQPARPAGDPAP